MSVNDRIQKIIDNLFLGNKRAFSNKVGIAATVTENIVGKRQSSPSFEVTNKIVSSIENINIEWLLTGKGEMLKVEMPRESNTNGIVSEDQVQYGNAPQYTTRPFIDSTLSITDNFNTTINLQNCKPLVIPFISEYDFSMRNYGESMINNDDPKKGINDLDIVACKFWNNQSYIRWGEIYALVTTNGCIIKKIMQSETEGKVKCVSLNETKGYKAYDLPVSEILDWAVVVGVLSVNIW